MLSNPTKTIWLYAIVALTLFLAPSVLIFLDLIPANQEFKGLASNLLAEGLGIAFAVLILERIFAYHKDTDRKIIEQAALRELRRPLEGVLKLFQTHFKDAVVVALRKAPATFEQILTSETAQRLASMNLYAAQESIFHAKTRFNARAKDVTGRYLPYLSLPVFRAIEDLAWALVPPEKPHALTHEETAEKFVKSLRTLVEVYNTTSDSPILPGGQL